MEPENEQAVATETAPEPAAPEPAPATSEEQGADDLGTLLTEYDKGTEPAPQEALRDDLDDLLEGYRPPDGPAPQAPAQDDLSALLEEHGRLGTDDQIAQIKVRQNDLEIGMLQRDLEAIGQEIIEEIRGATGAAPEAIKPWLADRMRNDPRLLAALRKRQQDPGLWTRMKSSLRETFEKQLPPPIDPEATATHDAVTSAVLAGKTRTPVAEPEPDFKGMSDQELTKWKREHGGGY